MSERMILIQNTKTRLELDVVGKVATFRPVGIVDEDMNFSIVLATIQRLGPANFEFRFDLEQIERINSCGVREWLLLMERLPPGARYSFLNVSELMVEQANMISGILGRPGTPVHTFQAPYHCGKCDKDLAILLEPKQIQFVKGAPVAPKVMCPTCSSELKFDWIEEEYFAFVRRGLGP